MLQSWQLLHEAITLSNKIGEGQFDEVFFGTLRLYKQREKSVAMQTLRRLTEKANRQQLIMEARFMRSFWHKNIVNLLSVAAQQEPVMFIMELALGGPLLAHLRTRIVGISLLARTNYAK